MREPGWARRTQEMLGDAGARGASRNARDGNCGPPGRRCARGPRRRRSRSPRRRPGHSRGWLRDGFTSAEIAALSCPQPAHGANGICARCSRSWGSPPQVRSAPWDLTPRRPRLTTRPRSAHADSGPAGDVLGLRRQRGHGDDLIRSCVEQPVHGTAPGRRRQPAPAGRPVHRSAPRCDDDAALPPPNRTATSTRSSRQRRRSASARAAWTCAIRARPGAALRRGSRVGARGLRLVGGQHVGADRDGTE